jgi:aspartate carbamoyltransferase catalytic subunit
MNEISCPPVKNRKDFLQIEGLSRAELTALLDAAESNLPIAEQRLPRKDLLQGRVVANIFLEDSTRTRCSFETAVHRLGGQVFTLGAAGTSASKGEGLLDTALNVEAMGVGAIVLRTAIAGAAHQVARRVRIPVINAGDGRHEHPTQGLLDLVTLRESLGNLEGKTVGIVGDIANSRVAHSAIHGLTILGCHVVLIGPPALVPISESKIVSNSELVVINHDLDSIIHDLDAIMLLRIQMERGSSNGVSNDYRTMYGLTQERASKLRSDAAVLHPGPINRGVEIDDSVADEHGGVRILRQVTHGVAARMAVLESLLG